LILNFCKQIWGLKGRHLYGRPRAALSLVTPLDSLALWLWVETNFLSEAAQCTITKLLEFLT